MSETKHEVKAILADRELLDEKCTAIAKQRKHRTVYDPSATAEIREQAIRTTIQANFTDLIKSPVKVDLHDLSMTKAMTERYITRCVELSVIPSFEGLCASLGITRKWAYEFLRNHPGEPTAEFLDNIRLAMAATRMSLAETKILDPATAIFVLKNSNLGFADRIAIEEPENHNPMAELDVAGARERLIAAIPDDDE